MARRQNSRIFGALAALLVVAGLAAGLSAPWSAVALTAALGLIAGWLAFTPAEPPLSGQPSARPDLPDPLPTLENIIAAIEDPILIVRRLQIVDFNDAAKTLLGEHIGGEDVRLAIRHPAAALLLTAPLTGSDTRSVELVGLGDRDRHWLLRVRPIDSERRLVHLRDRTESRVAEKMRVDFVANASHELRTPLATLLGFIETLADGKAGEDRETRERFLGIMFGEAKRMQRLVDDLMSLSRIEADKFSLPQTPVQLGPLVEEVRRALAATSDAVAGRLRLRTPPEPIGVAGDWAQLSQLLHNLIGNALKYSRPDAPVSIVIERSEDMARIIVADTGDGIAPEHLPRLTERFYRIDPGRSRAMGGTGLGLAIVKHIVERHRGRLDIDSTPGVGTTVAVSLPTMT